MHKRGESDFGREEEDESTSNKNNMEISEQVMGCISDLAFKYLAHRNEHLASSMRFFSSELKGKEPQSEKKRKKTSR
ncbi:hypothetical protein MKX01_016641 [Papaver californicum]|nr:hypothetical protein MKX01_016641 [Papaver californicum]